jgi:hypothetical protein
MSHLWDKVALGQGFLQVLHFYHVSIIPAWLSVLIYELEDGEQARWWPQFRDVVSPHGHEQENQTFRLYARASEIEKEKMNLTFSLITATVYSLHTSLRLSEEATEHGL